MTKDFFLINMKRRFQRCEWTFCLCLPRHASTPQRLSYSSDKSRDRHQRWCDQRSIQDGHERSCPRLMDLCHQHPSRPRFEKLRKIVIFCDSGSLKIPSLPAVEAPKEKFFGKAWKVLSEASRSIKNGCCPKTIEKLKAAEIINEYFHDMLRGWSSNINWSTNEKLTREKWSDMNFVESFKSWANK